MKDFLENKLFWLVAILLIFIPLYPKIPFLNVGGTYVAIRMEDLLIAFTIIVWLFCRFFDLKKILNQIIYQTFILYWLIGGLSILSAIFITYTIAPHIGILHWLRRIEYMSLFFIAATSIRNVSQIKLLLKLGVFATLVIILYGFGQLYLNFPVISTTNREFSKGLILYLTDNARVNSTFAGHYDLAVYLSLVLIMIAALIFQIKDRLFKLFTGFIGILSFILLGMTAARVSFVATVLGLMVLFWINGRKILIAALIGVTLLTIAVVPELRHRLVATLTVNLLGGGGAKYTPSENEVNIFTPMEQLSEASRTAILKELVASESSKANKTSTIAADIAPGEPLNATELGVYRSFGIRLDVEWPRAIRAFMKNPVLGTGYSSITLATDNDYLRSLGEVGLLGTLGLLLIFYLFFKNAFYFVRDNKGFERNFVLGVSCAIIGILITGIFIDVLEASKIASVMWILVGVCWAVMKGYKYK